MPYYKFDRNDIFVNTLKLFPEVKFVIYSGSSYYNSTPNISGAFTASIRCASPGDISLFEMNIDRSTDQAGPTIGLNNVPNTGLIYPWLTKDGSRLNFRTNTRASFINTAPGQLITGAPYPYTASISKEFYTATTARSIAAVIQGPQPNGDPQVLSSGSVSHITALKNTINYYRYLSPHFEYSSSTAALKSKIHRRDFDSSSLGLISVPSIFYGSQIRKGTVNLEFYYTGSLIARAQDTYRNGELVQTYGAAAASGTVVGLVLYNEGFVILTSSVDLGSTSQQDYYTSSTGLDKPRWTFFGQSISGSIIAPKSTFIMEMSGTSNTQVLTMFATAPKGQLNHSNNPTYLQATASNMSYVSTGAFGYIQSDTRPIKNVVSSAYADPTGSFEKTTYISKIGIYDRNKNLIGLAKVATPIKKTVERDFTFKIKLDI